jgi:hypothetical protein
MKKKIRLLLGLVLILVLATSVNAIYYGIGETVGLPYLETMETSDLDLSDGIGKYVYCSYAVDAPNTIENCRTLDDIERGACDIHIFEPLAWGGSYGDYVGMHTCGLYDITSPTGARRPFNINLTDGITEAVVTITSADITFNEAIDDWVLGEVKLIDSVSVTFKTIPEPDEEFIRTMISSISDINCEIFQFKWCTA